MKDSRPTWVTCLGLSMARSETAAKETAVKSIRIWIGNCYTVSVLILRQFTNISLISPIYPFCYAPPLVPILKSLKTSSCTIISLILHHHRHRHHPHHHCHHHQSPFHHHHNYWIRVHWCPMSSLQLYCGWPIIWSKFTSSPISSSKIII